MNDQEGLQEEWKKCCKLGEWGGDKRTDSCYIDAYSLSVKGESDDRACKIDKIMEGGGGKRWQ